MENNYLFSSNDYFTVIDFSLSHRILLLRSSEGVLVDDKINITNLDVAFLFTSYMEICPNLEGLNIKVASSEEKELLSQKLTIEEGKNIFVIESNEKSKYYIVCGALHIYKNNLPSDETSIGLKRTQQYTSSFLSEKILVFP